MKYIKLHGKYGEGKFTIVDDEEFDSLNKIKWFCKTDGYAIKVIKRNKKCRIIFMHSLVNGFAPKGMVTDHINRNKLDNRKSNLRFCTYRENVLNREWKKGIRLKKKNKKSLITVLKNVKGCSYRPDRKKWRATISFDGMWKHIGYFSTEEEAHKAYIQKRIELYNQNIV